MLIHSCEGEESLLPGFVLHGLKANAPCMIVQDTSIGIFRDGSFGIKHQSASVLENDWSRMSCRELMLDFFVDCTAPVCKGEECIEISVCDYFETYWDAGWYLKDFHFVREMVRLNVDMVYSTPLCFQDDWLNWWCWDRYDSLKDDCNDYRFMYCGPKGSMTPLHHDVLMSFSWSTNVIGSKLWILFPPKFKAILKKVHLIPSLQSMVVDCFENDGVLADFEKIVFEVLDSVYGLKGERPTVVLQRAGDTIFVPSEWFHQVHNLSDCLSINHNWFNRWNLSMVHSYLLEEFSATKAAISDCKTESGFDTEWEGVLCQKIMKLNVGVNLHEWFQLLVAKFESTENDKEYIINAVSDLEKKHPDLYSYFLSVTSLKDLLV